MKWVAWPNLGGSNSMVRRMAWNSVISKLDSMNLIYEEVKNRHVICMSDSDFVLFCLQWNPENIGFLQWTLINPSDELV